MLPWRLEPIALKLGPCPVIFNNLFGLAAAHLDDLRLILRVLGQTGAQARDLHNHILAIVGLLKRRDLAQAQNRVALLPRLSGDAITHGRLAALATLIPKGTSPLQRAGIEARFAAQDADPALRALMLEAYGAKLQADNPNWPDEPRDNHGRWLDVGKAAEHLMNHLQGRYGIGACAKHVREALAVGGIKIGSTSRANEMGHALQKGGFDKVADGLISDFEFEDGDVAVTTSGTGVSEYGHVAMYFEGKWYSDFTQNFPHPSRTAKWNSAHVDVYRYPRRR